MESSLSRYKRGEVGVGVGVAYRMSVSSLTRMLSESVNGFKFLRALKQAELQDDARRDIRSLVTFSLRMMVSMNLHMFGVGAAAEIKPTLNSPGTGRTCSRLSAEPWPSPECCSSQGGPSVCVSRDEMDAQAYSLFSTPQ